MLFTKRSFLKYLITALSSFLVCGIISDLQDTENATQNAFYKVAPEESLNILFLNPNLPINADENRSGICCSQREGGCGWCQGVT